MLVHPRILFDEVGAYEGGADVVGALLAPRADACRALLAQSSAWRTCRAEPADIDALHEWYAWSRLHDRLILSAQSELYAAKPYRGPPVDAEARANFFVSIGFSPIDELGDFHPFLHEIVAVEEDPAVTSSTVTKIWWPGWMWGEMSFARAGVTVRCPRGSVDVELAARSCLYFAYQRLHRPSADRSHGWGHNSQWATQFRRDFRTPTEYVYNADGQWSVEAGQPIEPEDRKLFEGLSLRARVQLLRYRSLVRPSPVDPAELYPYHDRYVEPR